MRSLLYSVFGVVCPMLAKRKFVELATNFFRCVDHLDDDKLVISLGRAEPAGRVTNLEEAAKCKAPRPCMLNFEVQLATLSSVFLLRKISVGEGNSIAFAH